MYISTPSETTHSFCFLFIVGKKSMHDGPLRRTSSFKTQFFLCTYESKSLRHPLQGKSALLALHRQDSMTQIPEGDTEEEVHIEVASFKVSSKSVRSFICTVYIR